MGTHAYITMWMEIGSPIQSLFKDVYPEHCVITVADILSFLLLGQAEGGQVLLVPGLFLLKFVRFLCREHSI